MLRDPAAAHRALMRPGLRHRRAAAARQAAGGNVEKVDTARLTPPRGGSWWLHTEIARAEASGDKKRAAKLQARADKMAAKSFARIGAGLGRVAKRR